MEHPCLRCGACCAYFRVAFHWSEADAALGGCVPQELTEKLDPHRLAMRGTDAAQPRCVALQGVVGQAAHCGIYAQRPSVCREVPPSWESGAGSPQCDKARLAHGLPLLTPQDWPAPSPSAIPSISQGADR
jgi:Fe-S-cluster containining protein